MSLPQNVAEEFCKEMEVCVCVCVCIQCLIYITQEIDGCPAWIVGDVVEGIDSVCVCVRVHVCVCVLVKTCVFAGDRTARLNQDLKIVDALNSQ